MAEPSEGPTARGDAGQARARFEVRLARIAVVFAVLAALLVGSNGFQVASWTGGDLAYHRGVALGMLGGDLQGEGPYAGLITYYGGLYPLGLGWLSGLSGLPFDTVLSVASWFGALAWPGALWLLGRRVWPDDELGRGLFVLLGTIAAPLTHRGPVWVNSVLASSQVAFPLYPRDVALTLLVLGAWAALGKTAGFRIWLTGVLLGLVVLFHLQIAVVAAGLLVAWRSWEAICGRRWSPVAESVAAGVVALVVAGPWLAPRVAATIASGHLLLADYPGTPVFRLGLDNAVAAFGVAGLLGGLGLLVLVAGRLAEEPSAGGRSGWVSAGGRSAGGRSSGVTLPGRVGPFAVWFVGLGCLGLLDRVLPGFDLVSERRLWLLGSVGLLVVAAAVSTVVVRRLTRLWAILFVVGVLVATAVPASVAVGVSVREAWVPGRAGGRTWDVGAWEAIWGTLTARVRQHRGETVATYDAYGTWVWSFSGAQVVAAWLPGPFKLGFDPAALTGHGQLERWQDVAAAFGRGEAGVCGLVGKYGARSILLDRLRTRADLPALLGWYDATPAAAFRVDPLERDLVSIDRSVGPGLRYLDLGIRDVLELAPGARWQPGWAAPALAAVRFEVEVGGDGGSEPESGAPVEGPGSVTTGSGLGVGGATTGGAGTPVGGLIRIVGPGAPERPLGNPGSSGPVELVVDVDGWRPDWVVEALVPIRLVRVTGFVPTAPVPGSVLAAPEPSGGGATGPVLLDAGLACGTMPR